jgi:hypothetical protein
MTTTTLKDRITSVLAANGFTEYSPFASGHTPMFDVAEGVGAAVNLSWEASPEDRALMLTKYENRLRENGLTVENRGHYLYVHEPATDTTARNP